MDQEMPSPPTLDRLYDEHAQALYSFLLNFTRSEADTHDLLQELFLKLAHRPGQLDGIGNTRAFLLRLAHNLAIDMIRRRGARDKAHDQLGANSIDLFAPSVDLDESRFRNALNTALEHLPAEQRAIVHLKLWEGSTFEQIAELLSISPNTAASRYRYGLDKLRELLRPLYDEINEL